jgi:hypothetical protein
MKAPLVIGILLIVIGVMSLVFQGITYTTKEDVIDLGPVNVTTETKKSVPLPPILGGIALAGGILLVAKSARAGRSV